MLRSRLLSPALAGVFALAVSVDAEAQAPLTPAALQSESLMLSVTGPPGLLADLEAAGFLTHDSRSRRSAETAHEIAEIILPSADVPRLRAVVPPGTLFAVLRRSEPLSVRVQAMAAALGPDMPDPGYRTSVEVTQELQALALANIGRATLFDLQGRYDAPLTHDGNHIFVLRISDNSDIDEDEPNILVFSNNHSRELNSIEAPIDVARRLLDGYGTDPVLTELVDENQIWILPNMNPDGLDHVWSSNDLWRKNRRDNGDGTYGVDLNRNYSFFWGQCGSSGNTGSDSYRGPMATSEPETQAMEIFALEEGFERLIDIHSFARDIRLPFNPQVRGRIPAWLEQGYDPIHQAIASAMNYAPSTTCCCGTHMEWHHANNGTLTFLVEMGTAFQPVFTETEQELQRMWPGMLEFLTQTVPLTGHVTSMQGGAPVVAELSIPSDPLLDGQRIRSVGRFGRYQIWCEPGTYTVRVEAPGFVSQDVQVTVQNGATTVQDIVLQPQTVPATLVGTDTDARIGQPFDLTFLSPSDAGKPYFLPFGFATSPGIDVGLGRVVEIAPNPILAEQTSLTSIFVGTSGVLDANGTAQAQFLVPPIPALAGMDVYFAGVTFDSAWLSGGVRSIADPLRLTLVQ